MYYKLGGDRQLPHVMHHRAANKTAYLHSLQGGQRVISLFLQQGGRRGELLNYIMNQTRCPIRYLAYILYFRVARTLCTVLQSETLPTRCYRVADK